MQSLDKYMKIDDSQFRAFFKSSPVPRLIIALTPAGGYVYADVNAAAAAYFERSTDQMIGKSPAEIFDPETATQLVQSYQSCLKAARSVTAKALPRFPGGVRVQGFVLTPLQGDDGVQYIEALARPDAMDDAAFLQEREDAILLLTSVFDASSLGIVVTDRHRRIVRVNAAFLETFGWQRDEVIGEFYTSMLPEADQEEAGMRHDAFIADGRSATREMQILRGDTGAPADVLVNLARLEMSQNRRFVVATFQDISPLKEIKKNLRHAKDEADNANAAKSAFLANMSHELRTPLNAIIGFSELINNGTFGVLNNEKYADYIMDIHYSARHLLDIINDVLDMSKIEAGKVELVESEVCLGEMCQSVVRIMEDHARDAGVTLETKLASDLPHLFADQRLLRQMLLNLVSNAVKFSKQGQAIQIRGMKHGDGVRLVIKDNGIGISPEKLKLVMEPFGQAEAPISRKCHGTGLGLPLARAMVELHGGSLSLVSEEGRGTEVCLDFPATRLLPAEHHNIS